MRDYSPLDGTHAFERVGLGKYPYTVAGFGKAETCCAFCGRPITYAARILSSDGREFKVGCDCVMRSGDAGLDRRIKSSPEYRAVQRDKRIAKDQAVQAELADLLARAGDRRVYFEARLKYCGMAGRAKIAKELREVIAPRETASND